MKIISGQRGQSAAEFAAILPVFILTSLGLLQLGLIYINAMLLNYTAYMTARVACVYDDADKRSANAGKAQLMMKALQASSGNYGNIASNALDSAADVALDAAASFLQSDELKIAKEDFTKAKGEFVRVTVTYNMPLRVPVVNKIFGMFRNKNEWDVFNARTAAAYAGFPFYTLKASSIMRVQ